MGCCGTCTDCDGLGVAVGQQGQQGIQGIQGPQGNPGQNGQNGTNGIGFLEVRKLLTAVQVNNMFAVNQQLVAAPGPGYAIEAIAAVASIETFVGPAYGFAGGSLQIGTATATTMQMAESNILTSTTARSSKMILLSNPGTTNQQIVENEPLMASLFAAPTIAGGSDLILYVLYRIITL
jgi:hypothetical protein